ATRGRARQSGRAERSRGLVDHRADRPAGSRARRGREVGKRGFGGNLIRLPDRAAKIPGVRMSGRVSGRAALVWGGLVVSALFAYLAVRHVHFREVWDALEASNYWWLVPAFGALVVATVLRAYRWQFLFARETRPPIRPVLSAMLIGQFVNNVLPARAGEAARVVALDQRSGW